MKILPFKPSNLSGADDRIALNVTYITTAHHCCKPFKANAFRQNSSALHLRQAYEQCLITEHHPPCRDIIYDQMYTFLNPPSCTLCTLPLSIKYSMCFSDCHYVCTVHSSYAHRVLDVLFSLSLCAPFPLILHVSFASLWTRIP